MVILSQQSETLDKKIIAQIKKDLIKRKVRVLEDLKVVSKKDRGGKNEHKARFPNFGDKVDENAQEISEYSTNLATEKVLESTLRDINNRLARIEKGTYGICRYCKKEISKRRMIARPVANTCVKCKTKLQNQ